jgi:Predicted metal-binding integral membrane protein (DUF2182)
MKTSTLVIITIVLSISVLTWLVSIWQYDAMMSSMMTFYYNPAALSLFVVIWTAGMAAMMFPAIVPMILVFNRLINMNNATSNNPGNSNSNSQTAYHTSSDPNYGSSTNNGIGYPAEEGGDKSNIIHRLRNTLQSKSPVIILFVSAYLAIWALTGIVLLVGWSFFFDTLLLQLGLNDSQQQQLLSANTIYGIVLIVAGIYQFISLKTKCLGYCESPLSFFMRRWQKGRVGAVKMDVSWSILSWLLLALFSTYGSTRMDECTLDGIICGNHLCRESMDQRWSLDRKDNRYRFYCPRDTVCNCFDIVAIQSYE